MKKFAGILKVFGKILLKVVHIAAFLTALLFAFVLSPGPFGCAFMTLAILLLPIKPFQSLFAKNCTTRVIQIALYALSVLGIAASYIWADANYNPDAKYVSEIFYWGTPWFARLFIR